MVVVRVCTRFGNCLLNTQHTNNSCLTVLYTFYEEGGVCTPARGQVRSLIEQSTRIISFNLFDGYLDCSSEKDISVTLISLAFIRLVVYLGCFD